MRAHIWVLIGQELGKYTRPQKPVLACRHVYSEGKKLRERIQIVNVGRISQDARVSVTTLGEVTGASAPTNQIKGLSVTIFLQKRGHWMTDQKRGCKVAQKPGNF